MVSMSKAKMENRALPKRFYLEALSAPADDGWAILLDGKPIKTMAKYPLVVKNKHLADAMAAEWRAQKTHIDPETMPLTRLANILIDRVALDRDLLLEDMLRYGETDLICYRAEAGSALNHKQAAHFEPILAWAQMEFGIQLHVIEGVMPIDQPGSSIAEIDMLFSESTDGELAALAMLVSLLGSALLALALWKGRLNIDQALAAARLDEDEQIRQWGEDAEAKALWEMKQKDIRAAAFFLDMQVADKAL
jgi:chaperone required for assembly of F1-ATPase